MMLQRGRNVGQEHEWTLLVRFRQSRREGLEHTKFRRQRPAIIHVHFIFARPMKGLATRRLQSFKINAVTAIQLNVAPGEIVADDADQFDRRKKTCRYRRMTGRSAKESR